MIIGKLLKEHVGHIVHEYLSLRKLYAKWVPVTIDWITISQINENNARIERTMIPIDYSYFKIIETDSHFEAKGQSYYKSSTEKLEVGRVSMKNLLNNNSEFFEKK